MLEPEEFARRLKAARELAGVKQRELAEVTAAEDQLGIEDVGRLERPSDPKKPPPEVSLKHVQVYARRLGVPEAWFTNPVLPALFNAEASAGAAIELLQRQIDELRDQLVKQAGLLARVGAAEVNEAPAQTPSLQGQSEDARG